MSKKAFVTGGGTGIGKQIAVTLLQNGYDVAVSYYSSYESIQELAEIGKQFGRKAVGIRADISKVSEIKNMFQSYRNELGDKLDLFVNNAGVTMKSTFLDTTEDLFDAICDVDYKGAFFCMQEAAKMMTATGGNIILISSNNAKAHFADVSVYGSAKAAATKLAEHMAIELAQYNIRVNTIAPGWTDTGASRLDEKESTYYKIPLQKWVDVKEIAQTVLYLASSAAKSVTGAIIVMDNGALLVSDKREKYGF